jgi:hypothetical protein
MHTGEDTTFSVASTKHLTGPRFFLQPFKPLDRAAVQDWSHTFLPFSMDHCNAIRNAKQRGNAKTTANDDE